MIYYPLEHIRRAEVISLFFPLPPLLGPASSFFRQIDSFVPASHPYWLALSGFKKIALLPKPRHAVSYIELADLLGGFSSPKTYYGIIFFTCSAFGIPCLSRCCQSGFDTEGSPVENSVFPSLPSSAFPFFLIPCCPGISAVQRTPFGGHLTVLQPDFLFT